MRFPCVIASFIHSAAARFVCFTFYDYYCCSRRSCCCCCRSCSCSCCCCALRSLNLCFMFEQSSKKKRKKTTRRTLSLFAAPLTAPALCSCATHSLSLSLSATWHSPTVSGRHWNTKRGRRRSHSKWTGARKKLI